MFIPFCKKLSLFAYIALIAVIVCSSGCTLDGWRKPNIEETPPYYQNNEFDNMRSLHDRERESMANQMHIVRNKELERLEKAIEEDKKDKEWEEDYQRTLERREKWNLWNKFKSGGDKTYLMSDEAKKIHSNLER